jgi:uncharacterized protein with HEPN domain
MREDREWLREILQEIDNVHGFIDGRTRTDFGNDLMLQRSVLHSLIIIGEATSRLSGEFRSRHPNIPWRDISAMRNILVHSYFAVDLDIAWQTASRDLGPLQQLIEQSLES